MKRKVGIDIDVVLAALKRIGDDQEARFKFFRRLLVVAEDAVAARSL